MFDSSKGVGYRIFKISFSLESYLSSLPFKYLKYFCRFRTCNIKILVEVGRWYHIYQEKKESLNYDQKMKLVMSFTIFFICNDPIISQSTIVLL